MPFTQTQIPSDKTSNRSAEDKQTTETVQHAHLINDQYKSLTEIDIKTAEITAKMVNAGKILSGLLVYLTSPKQRVESTVISKETQKTERKGSQATKGPFSTAKKQPNLPGHAHELQGLEEVWDQKRVVSYPESDSNRVMVAVEENSVREDTSAAGNSLSDGSVTTIGSPKEEKASKENGQSRKQPNGRTRIKAVSTVSAYPTQRPPHKKPARNAVAVKEPQQQQKLESEERDPEQLPATPSPVLDSSDHDDHEANAPEQLLVLEESLQEDHASPDSSLEGHEDSSFYTPEETFGREPIATEVGLLPSDIFHGEDPTTTADEPVALSLPTQPRQQYGGGAQGLLWAYAISLEVDKALDDAGVFLWRKPNAHFRAERLLRTQDFGQSFITPVVISHENTGDDEPIIEFDGDTVHIIPHGQCWEDVRSHEFHPDFLVPRKLAEYQACEAAGYQVWRHDRDLLKCRKSDCKASVSDYHRSVVVCLGCGPKSIVRYCSLQHQLDDIEGHWKDCGTWKVVLRRVIDHATAPSRFDRMYPAIKQRHGSKTAALHRQRLWYSLTSGHYTLFDPASDRSKTLCWPKQDPKWLEMDRRLERLLNVAFFDSCNHVILGYLYRLLRELLRSQGEWFESTERLLKLQLESEFSDYKVNTEWKNGDAPCQCEWSGKIVPRSDHLSTCWAYATETEADDRCPARRPNCIEAIVEGYEQRFWILRAWRQQYPAEINWRRRAAGYGFPNNIPDEGCYKLGPGWTGWGGEKDDICEDQGNHGERGSMRSV